MDRDGSQAQDPVLAKRARILHWTEVGQRVAYVCFALSVVVFVIAFIAQFPPWTVSVIVGLIVVGSVVFIPAVILGHAAKAADREDRGETSHY